MRRLREAWNAFVRYFAGLPAPSLRDVEFVGGDAWPGPGGDQGAKDEQAMRDAMVAEPDALGFDGWRPARGVVRYAEVRPDSATVFGIAGPLTEATDRADRALEESRGLEVYRTRGGRWKWRVRIDGKIVRVSATTYARKAAALRGWRRAKRAAA